MHKNLTFTQWLIFRLYFIFRIQIFAFSKFPLLILLPFRTHSSHLYWNGRRCKMLQHQISCFFFKFVMHALNNKIKIKLWHYIPCMDFPIMFAAWHNSLFSISLKLEILRLRITMIYDKNISRVHRKNESFSCCIFNWFIALISCIWLVQLIVSNDN